MKKPKDFAQPINDFITDIDSSNFNERNFAEKTIKQLWPIPEFKKIYQTHFQNISSKKGINFSLLKKPQQNIILNKIAELLSFYRKYSSDCDSCTLLFDNGTFKMISKTNCSINSLYHLHKKLNIIKPDNLPTKILSLNSDDAVKICTNWKNLISCNLGDFCLDKLDLVSQNWWKQAIENKYCQNIKLALNNDFYLRENNNFQLVIRLKLNDFGSQFSNVEGFYQYAILYYYYCLVAWLINQNFYQNYKYLNCKEFFVFTNDINSSTKHREQIANLINYDILILDNFDLLNPDKYSASYYNTDDDHSRYLKNYVPNWSELFELRKEVNKFTLINCVFDVHQPTYRYTKVSMKMKTHWNEKTHWKPAYLKKLFSANWIGIYKFYRNFFEGLYSLKHDNEDAFRVVNQHFLTLIDMIFKPLIASEEFVTKPLIFSQFNEHDLDDWVNAINAIIKKKTT